MNSICSEDDLDLDWDWDPEYYLMPSKKVARIVSDETGEEYAIAEAMGPEAVWRECDLDQVLAMGRLISEEEAIDMVDGFGGNMRRRS